VICRRGPGAGDSGMDGLEMNGASALVGSFQEDSSSGHPDQTLVVADPFHTTSDTGVAACEERAKHMGRCLDRLFANDVPSRQRRALNLWRHKQMTRKERAAFLLKRQMDAIRKHFERLAFARLKAQGLTPWSVTHRKEEPRPRGVSGTLAGGSPAPRYNRSALSINIASKSLALPLASPTGGADRMERLERAHIPFSGAAIAKATAQSNFAREPFGVEFRSSGPGGFKLAACSSPGSRGRARVGRPTACMFQSQSLPQLVSSQPIAGKASYLTTTCTLVRS
jgi:hypothetical protein